ncbi:MAG: amidophosphoribosyltransferase [Chloroflexota bacterium]|nr:amidophosphoribosyltransferase [Chloroflexota bacterium]MDE2683515.1 amidophosphoribosyltransferase [Chloroflexota bacterium]
MSLRSFGQWDAVPFDHPREECGVVGIYSPGAHSATLTAIGLFALQHRGQESAGVAAAEDGTIRVHTGMGLVSEAFHDGDLDRITGHMAVGHTRYSTTGSSDACNAQPLLVDGCNGKLAVAHNGNIINAVQLREQLRARWDCQFETTTDTEVIAHLLANSPGTAWPERLFSGMRMMQGAFSLALLTPTALIAARDPLGIRPLCLGRLPADNGSGWVFASETCALDHMQAEFVRELEPGEVVVITGDGIYSEVYRGEKQRDRALCVFEWIYFARPDSMMDDRLMHTVREEMGAELAREHPADADLVIGIPDSSTSAAVGFARESGIPFANGLVRNRYVGRTFIEPEQQRRDRGVRQKFNPMPAVLRGKRLVVVDDSIVRGTTTPHVVELLRRAGASEIHLRVCAPPIKHPCYLGVDMATRQELIAANKSIEEIRELTGADTLGYLSVGGLMGVAKPGNAQGGFCDACFTGNYPVPVQLDFSKMALERAAS